MCLEMDAGSLSVHDSFVLHGSEANTSGRRRAAYTMRYANTKTVRVSTIEHWVPVYLVRGEADNVDYIDIRPGQSLPDSTRVFAGMPSFPTNSKASTLFLTVIGFTTGILFRTQRVKF